MTEHAGLQAEVAALRAEVARLQRIVAALTGAPVRTAAAAGTPVAAAAAGTPRPVTSAAGPGLSRRRLLATLPGVAAAGAGMAVLAGLADPQAASATAGSPVLLGRSNDAGTTTTTLASTADPVLQVGDPTTDPDGVALSPGSVAVSQVKVDESTRPSALAVTYQAPDAGGFASLTVLPDGGTDPFVSVQGYQFADQGSGGTTAMQVSSLGPASALRVRSPLGYASDNSTVPGTALDAAADGAGTGLLVTSQSGHAVQASTTSGSAAADAVVVTTAGLGRAVYACATSSHSTVGAVTGVTAGSGAGVSGTASSTTLAGVGVVGTGGAAGRGGRFKGGAAAVQLVPGTASSHPTTGQAGDLMVDSTYRLWYCQKSSSGTTAAIWKQLA